MIGERALRTWRTIASVTCVVNDSCGRYAAENGLSPGSTGDPSDQVVVDAILADLRSDRVVAEPASSLGELMERMAEVDAVVASRYHNVLSALKLAKPTISVSYAGKNDVLMQDMGLGEYCQPIRELDVPRLIEQFHALTADRDRLRYVLLDRREHNRKLLDEQDAVLSATLFGAAGNQ